MRLIDADALIKNILESDSYNDYEWSSYADEIIDDKINEAPTIEPKRGKWIEPTDDDGISITGRCSNCGWESHLCEDDVAGMPYCPNCGALMREREGE